MERRNKSYNLHLIINPMNKRFGSIVTSFLLFPFLAFPNYSNSSQAIVQQVNPASLEEKLNPLKVPLISKIKKNMIENEIASFYIDINKKNLKLNLFQKVKGEDIFLLESSVGLGMKGFSTPTGNFYIRRIVNLPIWYPPKWANMKTIPKPGKDNPYGLWMSELSTENERGDNNFSVSGDSKIRIHSTNEPSRTNGYFSHGCIRLHPDIADEFFSALLKYTPRGEEKRNARGIIYPLEKTIPVIIK